MGMVPFWAVASNDPEATVLTKEQGEILQVIQDLPAPQVQAIRDFALFLKQRYGNEPPLDESDVWSEEDTRDLATAALRHAGEATPVESGEREP
jgi:hypothetical protein